MGIKWKQHAEKGDLLSLAMKAILGSDNFLKKKDSELWQGLIKFTSLLHFISRYLELHFVDESY